MTNNAKIEEAINIYDGIAVSQSAGGCPSIDRDLARMFNYAPGRTGSRKSDGLSIHPTQTLKHERQLYPVTRIDGKEYS